MNIIKKGAKEFLNIFDIIKNNEFKGYTGIAIKNSIYQSATTLIMKIGALIFMVILARILMPELFGLYSLALSTILLFVSFSDLGIGQTLIKFVSQALGKNKQSKAKAYVLHLTKIKIMFLFLTITILAISAKFISNNFYNKPIFLALLAGIFYIFIVGIIGFVQVFFQSVNNFKVLFFKEIFFQTLRIIMVPLLILYSLQHFVSKEISIFIVIISLGFVWLLTFLFLFIFGRSRLPFLKVEASKLQKNEKKKINRFVLNLIAFSLSGIFFSYIDILFLGHFVLSNFIGYYAVTLGLLASLPPLIGFSSVLFPIFSRIKGERLERGFKKTIRITVFLALLFFIFVFVFASLIIKIIYGEAYLNAIPLLRLLSFLLISMPLIPLYTTYFIARGKPKIVTKFLLISAIINIILNYILIIWLIDYSQMAAVIGVCLATLISNYFLLFGLVFIRKKHKKVFKKSQSL